MQCYSVWFGVWVACAGCFSTASWWVGQHTVLSVSSFCQKQAATIAKVLLGDI